MPNLLIVSKSGPANSIQILDIWWSSLDITDDFKLISTMAIFHFSEINKLIFLVISKILLKLTVLRLTVLKSKKYDYTGFCLGFFSILIFNVAQNILVFGLYLSKLSNVCAMPLSISWLRCPLDD